MNGINFDKTYCASPECKNKCGSKLILDFSMKNRLNYQLPGWEDRISFGYFCNESGELIKGEK